MRVRGEAAATPDQALTEYCRRRPPFQRLDSACRARTGAAIDRAGADVRRSPARRAGGRGAPEQSRPSGGRRARRRRPGVDHAGARAAGPQIFLASGAGVVGRDDTKDRSGLIGEVSWELDCGTRLRAGRAAAAAREAADTDCSTTRRRAGRHRRHVVTADDRDGALRLTAAEAGVGVRRSGAPGPDEASGRKVSRQDVASPARIAIARCTWERVYAHLRTAGRRGFEIVIAAIRASEPALAADLPALPRRCRRAAVGTAGAAAGSIPAERRVAAAFQLIQVAQATRLPRVALTGSGADRRGQLLRLANVAPDSGRYSRTFLRRSSRWRAGGAGGHRHGRAAGGAGATGRPRCARSARSRPPSPANSCSRTSRRTWRGCRAGFRCVAPRPRAVQRRGDRSARRAAAAERGSSTPAST